MVANLTKACSWGITEEMVEGGRAGGEGVDVGGPGEETGLLGEPRGCGDFVCFGVGGGLCVRDEGVEGGEAGSESCLDRHGGDG